jgi:thiamine monophosphate kinase
MVVGGGEDYELLVALPPDQIGTTSVELTPVGRCVEEGVWLVRGGERMPLPSAGWDHFKP